MKSAIAMIVSVCLVLGALLGHVSSASAASPDEPPRGQYRPDLRAGDHVRSRDLVVEVPAAGFRMVGFALADDGSSAQLAVTTGSDGRVFVDDSPDHALSGSGSPSANEYAPCSTEASIFLTFSNYGADGFDGVSGDHNLWWYFRSGSTPVRTGFTEADAIAAIKRGASNMTTAYNDCGMPDQVSATQTYGGATTASSNVTSSGCAFPNTYPTRDEDSIVEFGLLDSGVAVECSTYRESDGRIIAADIRFKKWAGWSTATSGSDCVNNYDVEGVATHEFGHAFGLAHPSEDTRYGKMTMYGTAIYAVNCRTAARSLARGDVLGLESMY